MSVFDVVAQLARAVERGTLPAPTHVSTGYGRASVHASRADEPSLVHWLTRVYGEPTEENHRRPQKGSRRGQWVDQVDLEWEVPGRHATVSTVVHRPHVCTGPFRSYVARGETGPPVWRCRCDKKLGVRKARELGLAP